MFFIGTVRKWLWDRERCIFRYYDGSRTRYADPVEIGVRLEEIDPDYQDKLDLIARDAEKIPPGPARDDFRKSQIDAARKIADMTRKAFGISPLSSDGGGMSQGEVANVLAQYLIFMEGLARAARLFRDSQSAASGSPQDSPTERSADSGSVASPFDPS